MDRLTSMNKYSHSNMPGRHRSDAQSPIFDQPHPSRAPPDEHYTNSEHPTQRRRLDTPSTLRPHYPGDGLDFRRPVMSASGRDGSSGSGPNYRQEEPIDLTDERLDQSGPNTQLPHTATQPHTASDTERVEAHSSNSRAQRLPRFQRDIIDLAGSDDEEQAQPQQQPQDRRIFGYPVAEDEDSLFIPETHPRPTTAGLRRPGFIRQPSPAMELNDVEFVASRPISRLTSRRPTPARASSRTPHPAASFDNDMNQPIDLTADDDGDDDDDVIHTSTRPIPSVNGDRPAMAGSGIGVRDPPTYGAGLGRLVQRMHRARPGLPGFLFGRHPEFGGDDLERIRANQDEAQQRAEQAREHTQVLQVHLARARAELVREGGGGGRPPRPRPRAAPVINMNLNMDYGLVGFDLGFGAAPPRPPTPKYEPPPPAEKGFTHSPEENEEVVCPNCGDELAVGDGEVKQQIYVVKTCGHAYCGECATRERPHSSKKGKGKALDPSLPPPLKKCVVVGCEKSATKSQMIHVFMSS